jgi:hypothetical protein
MAETLFDLQLQLEKLRKARNSGARRVEFGERRVEYRSDEELTRAISATEAEINRMQGVSTVRNIVIRSARP